MDDEEREALAEALAERYTSEHGARNPAWDIDQPDGPENPYHLTRPMAERIDGAPYVVFTDYDGCRSIRMPSCAELADTLLPVVDAIARRRASEELRAAATALKWAVITDQLGTPMDTVRDLRARAEALAHHEEAL